MSEKMDIFIRWATEQDFPAIFSIIKELAAFENASSTQVTNSIEQMKRERDFFSCFVAEKADKEIIGIALFYFVYYTWVGKSLYLEDFFVKDEYRGRNVGTSLLEKVFEIAKKEDCKRIRWQVLRWNKEAIRLYRKFNAEIDDEWYNCTVKQHDIQNFNIKL
ncbi:MAG TPA: GNAT family N-acetyltransferase [Bacteroidales bacterium]|nr:GNAT family N-acetyltransferase [Bacteroidales bacterium]